MNEDLNQRQNAPGSRWMHFPESTKSSVQHPSETQSAQTLLSLKAVLHGGDKVPQNCPQKDEATLATESLFPTTINQEMHNDE